MTTDFNGYMDTGEAVALQSDGRIVVAGLASDGSLDDVGLVRYNADGTLDVTFSGDGRLTTALGSSSDGAFAIALQPDGKIVVAGFSRQGATEDFAVVRYSTDGSLDTSFSGDGMVTTAIGSGDDRIYAIALQPDGRIVVAGQSHNGTNYDFAVARYNSDGTLDTSFSGDGMATTAMSTGTDSGRGIALQSDGKILVAGSANADFGVARYNTDGSLDTSFDADGQVTTPVGSFGDYVTDITLQPDGKILVGGYSYNGSNDDFALVRYNTNGSLDTTFSGDGKVTTAISAAGDLGTDLALQADGKILVAGYALVSNEDIAVVRYNSDGSLDTTFSADGKLTTTIGTGDDRASAVAFQPDGRIVVAGQSYNGSNNDFAVVRYNWDGSLDNSCTPPPTFTPTPSSTPTDTPTPSNTPTDTPTPSNTPTDTPTPSNTPTDTPTPSSTPTDTPTDTPTPSATPTDTPTPSDTPTPTATGACVGFGGDGIVTTGFGSGGDSGNAIVVQPDGKILVVGQSFSGTADDFALARYNSDGSLDTSFDGDGRVTTVVTAVWDAAFAVALEPDGQILVAGYAANDFALVRYNSDGSLDTSFSGDGMVTTDIGGGTDRGYAVALQSDGKILVAGYAVIGVDRFAVVRYNSDGSLDTSFDGDGILTTAVGISGDTARAIVLQSDGKILVAGESYTGSNDDFAVVRYNTNGSLDTTFSGDGIVTTPIGTSHDVAYAMTLQSDGKILVAGSAVMGNIDFAVVRYDTTGSLDTTFDGDGIVTTALGSFSDYGYAVALQTDNKILVAGLYNGISNDDFGLVRYNSDGSLDTSFDGDGVVTTAIGTSSDIGRSMALQTDGKILVAGSTTGSTTDFAVVRYFSDGSLDACAPEPTFTPTPTNTRTPTPTPTASNTATPTATGGPCGFDTDGIATTTVGSAADTADAIAIQSDGRILVAGYSSNGTNDDFALVRYNSDGSLDTTFDGDGQVTTAFGGSADRGKAIVIQPDGRILVAGYAALSNDDFAVVRYNADGSLDTSFSGDGKVTTAIGSASDQAYAIALQTDGKILVAGASFIGFQYDSVVARYNSDGTLDTTFSGDGILIVDLAAGAGGDYSYAVAVQPDGKILLGGYVQVGVQYDFVAARLNSDGSLDTTFSGDGIATAAIGSSFDFAYAMALQPDGKIVLAGTSSMATYDFSVARFNSDGSLDTSFAGDGTLSTTIGSTSDYGYVVTLQPDGKILVAGYASMSTTDVAVVRYNSDGSLDTSFSGDGKVTTAVGTGTDHGYAITVQTDGKIVVAGDAAMSTVDFAVVRYNWDGSLDDSCTPPPTWTPTPTATYTPTPTSTDTPTPTATAVVPQVDAQVSASSDDAVRWSVNSFLLDSPNDWLDTFNTPSSSTGLRFTGVAVPNGATITAAYLTVRARFSASPTEGTTIYGQSADNPVTFSTWGDYDFRVRTTASVPWQPAGWTADTDYNSPSLTAVIQEIVARPGWTSGNALVLFLVPDGNQNIWAYAYDSSATYAPRLHIEYAAPTATPTATATDTPTPTSTGTATPTPTSTATPTPTATAVPTLFYFYDDTTPLQYMMYQTVPAGTRTTATNTTVNFYSDLWAAGWQVTSGSSIVCIHVSTNGSRTITFTVYGGTTQLGTQPVSVTGNGSAQCFFVTTSNYTFAAGERLRLVVAVPSNATISWDGADSDSSYRVPGIVVP